ncbi:MAG: cysteine desulfurase [Parcubacteria group bacterium]|nr:cysteine desulfurase [Parcubacteria group bacterium]
MRNNEKIYLDYAASTPLDPKVIKKTRQVEKIFGNPSSIHSFGMVARAVIDRARSEVANFLGAASREIIFTSGATEANNLVIQGLVKYWQRANSGKAKPHIITTVIEHESILNLIEGLERNEELEVSYLEPNKNGLVSPEDVRLALKQNTILVSVIFASNVMGAIQPIARIGKIIKEYRKKNKIQYPYFHTDAVQMFQWLDEKVDDLGVDLLTFSGHKIFGPKGIGGLYIRDNVILYPMIVGGGQEYGFRSGTENLIGIAALGEAIKILKPEYKKKVTGLRDFLIKEIEKIPGAKLNVDKSNIVPHILSARFSGISGEDLLIALDRAGAAVSYGSACASRAAKTSSALLAIGLSEKEAGSSPRISLGRTTTKEELVKFLKILRTTIQNLKK